MLNERIFRAGDEVEDLCRACKADRSHTVIVVDGTGWPLRVQCGFCQSQHNYRGGPRTTNHEQRTTDQEAASALRATAPRPRTTNHEPPT